MFQISQKKGNVRAMLGAEQGVDGEHAFEAFVAELQNKYILLF